VKSLLDDQELEIPRSEYVIYPIRRHIQATSIVLNESELKSTRGLFSKDGLIWKKKGKLLLMKLSGVSLLLDPMFEAGACLNGRK